MDFIILLNYVLFMHLLTEFILLSPLNEFTLDWNWDSPGRIGMRSIKYGLIMLFALMLNFLVNSNVSFIGSLIWVGSFTLTHLCLGFLTINFQDRYWIHNDIKSLFALIGFTQIVQVSVILVGVIYAKV